MLTASVFRFRIDQRQHIVLTWRTGPIVACPSWSGQRVRNLDLHETTNTLCMLLICFPLLDHSSWVLVLRSPLLAVPFFEITYRSPSQQFLHAQVRLIMCQLSRFFTPTRNCSEDTELICWVHCAKQEFCIRRFRIEMDRTYSAFPFWESSIQRIGTSQCWMSTFFEILHHGRISLLCRINVVEHGHQDDSIFEFFGTCVTSFQFVLNLLDNLQCCKFWENFPLTLCWFSIDPGCLFASLDCWKSWSWSFHFGRASECSCIFPRQRTESE